MVNFTNNELADIHYMYGLADGNSSKARRLYEERFPGRVVPARKTFYKLHLRLSEKGSFKPNNHLKGTLKTARTPQTEDAVLNMVEENPEISARKIAHHLNINYVLVWRILHDFLLYPFHIQRVQALLPRDFPLRTNFCQWFLRKLAVDPLFGSKILFTDESAFSKNSIRNFHNKHFWAEENPHKIKETHYQDQFSVNVWIGIIGDYLIGPFFLPERLNGESYRRFLEDILPILLEDVPIFTRSVMWFMHDGAPAHFSVQARNYLNQNYHNRWIGRGGPREWPPRSPDLNSLDFFLWGHLKTLVYSTPVQSVEELKNRITNSCEQIRNTPGIFQRVRESMRRRAEACILAGGGHFQQLL